MVKIYGTSGASFSSMAEYVSLEDYQSLLGALREALEGWKGCHVEEEWERIEQLQKQFLDI